MNILIFGGTGSLGKVLTKRYLSKGYKVFAFSRDEAKCVNYKRLFPDAYCIIGDVRDYNSVFSAICKVRPNIIIFASALKNVPEVEEFPFEAVKTNILGAENVFRAAIQYGQGVKVLSVSTDKACLPINSYGMTKALQERLAIRSNYYNCIVNNVRYGNVLESRGSVIPFFKDRIMNGETIPVTHRDMTRFFLSLDQSVDLIETALEDRVGGKTFIPMVKSAKIIDLAEVMCDFFNYNKSKIIDVSVRPGEKLHESLISEEEIGRTEDRSDVYIIHDVMTNVKFDHLHSSYSSKHCLMTKDQLKEFLVYHKVLT